jgi:DNA-binding response OmpR family regulator
VVPPAMNGSAEPCPCEAPAPARARVFVVEDEPVQRAALVACLRDAGHTVTAFADGRHLLRRVAEEDPELVLVDLRLPDADGLELVRAIRGQGDCGVIVVTARDGVTDRVIGLECGADDYVVKPFEPRELVTRARNLLHRVRRQRGRNQGLRFAGWFLDRRTRLLRDPGGRPVPLSGSEFRLLTLLLEHPGEPLSRQQLLMHLHDQRSTASDRTVDVLVSKLRQKLGDVQQAGRSRLIATIRGVGYAFQPPGE